MARAGPRPPGTRGTRLRRGVVTLRKIGRSIVGIRSNRHAAVTTSRHACRAEALKALSRRFGLAVPLAVK
jgi:hypothetical protein